MTMVGICSMCGRPASGTCRLCGRVVCAFCSNPTTGVCRGCAGKQKTIPKMT